MIKRVVGACQQPVGIPCRHGVDRDADAGADLGDHAAIEMEGQVRRVDDRLGDHADGFDGLDVFQEDHELVAAQPSDRVDLAQTQAQAIGHLAQHLIAGVMAVAVINRLEPSRSMNSTAT